MKTTLPDGTYKFQTSGGYAGPNNVDVVVTDGVVSSWRVTAPDGEILQELKDVKLLDPAGTLTAVLANRIDLYQRGLTQIEFRSALRDRHDDEVAA